MNKIPFTRAAYEKLQAELKTLTEERQAVMGRLQTAREMGDLSENGAYKYAKIELGNINRRLRELKRLLENGEVKEIVKGDTVAFGGTVTITNGKKQATYLMVSEYESDPLHGKLSTTSPIGQSIVGKKVGDSVMVKTPAGEMKYTIQSLSFEE